MYLFHSLGPNSLAFEIGHVVNMTSVLRLRSSLQQVSESTLQ